MKCIIVVIILFLIILHLYLKSEQVSQELEFIIERIDKIIDSDAFFKKQTQIDILFEAADKVADGLSKLTSFLIKILTAIFAGIPGAIIVVFPILALNGIIHDVKIETYIALYPILLFAIYNPYKFAFKITNLREKINYRKKIVEELRKGKTSSED